MKKLSIYLLTFFLSGTIYGAQKPLDSNVNLIHTLCEKPYDYEAIKAAATQDGIEPTKKSLCALITLYESARSYRHGIKQKPLHIFPLRSLHTLLNAGFNPYQKKTHHYSPQGTLLTENFITFLKRQETEKPPRFDNAKDILRCAIAWEKAKKERIGETSR